MTMRPAARAALIATAFAALAGMGLAHGLLTDRWAADPAAQGPPLDRVPLAVGDWDGATIDATPDQLPASEPGTVLLRRYVNRVNGAAVTLFLTVGRPGPIVASHAPDSCYPGAGFACDGPIVRQSVAPEGGGRANQFRVAEYSKTERASPLHLRVFWGWSADGAWQTPDYPRLAFAGKKRLYKLYVIRQLPKGGEPLDDDPAVAFLRALTPELQKTLMADG
jgi:hypothetical protein